MSDAEPGLMQKAEVKIKDNIDGSVYIQINNTSAFGDKISNVVKQYLNTFKYKKAVNKPD
jgi:citrate lyase gamma subunit